MNDVGTLPKVMNRAATDAPLRILVLYSRNPFPMMRGDQLTVSHLLSYLWARGHNVDLLSLDLDGQHTPAQANWLSQTCRRVDLIPHSPLAKLRGLIKAALRLQPLQVGLFDSPTLRRIAHDRITAGEYDIVYCYYLRSAPALPHGFRPNATQQFSGRTTAAFLAMQLSQTLNTKRIAANSRSLIKKLLYLAEARLMRRYEARIWRHFSKVLLIGPKDVEAITDACAEEGQAMPSNWLYGAHGTDVQTFRPADPEDVIPNRIVFSGSMAYAPNVQAAIWFHRHCWPVIKAQAPDAEWWIVGRDPTPEVQAMAQPPDITVTGTVPDISAEIRRAALCINPMQAAAGMQNKLIEYMACAKPTVATRIANEGIRAPADTLVLADTGPEFAEAVLHLLRDAQTAADLGGKARAFVLKHWTWEAHFDRLEADFYSALNPQPATAQTAETAFPTQRLTTPAQPSEVLSDAL